MIGNLLRAALFLCLLAATAGIGATANAQTLALVGGKVYASPDATPLDDAVVVTANGVITAIGSRSEVQIPSDARVIDCTGKTVVAGFWNSHVHFTQAVWKNAGSRACRTDGRAHAGDADAVGFHRRMGPRLRRTQYHAVAPARQFRRGAGPGYPSGRQHLPQGTAIPPICRRRCNSPKPPRRTKPRNWRAPICGFGLDGMKLFTGSFKGSGKPVVNMDPAIAKAAVDVAHAAGKPVFAHPQNMAGVEAVIAAGVDVMAHTVAGEPVYSPEQLARFKQQGIALIPTLSLFAKLPVGPDIAARLVATTVNQVKAFSDNGGPVLFGTDVGFTTYYDTTLEYELMHRALSERQILASLTTNPAQYFKAAKKGRVEKGFDADVVVLDGDPHRRCHQPRQGRLHDPRRQGDLSKTLTSAEPGICDCRRNQHRRISPQLPHRLYLHPPLSYCRT